MPFKPSSRWCLALLAVIAAATAFTLPILAAALQRSEATRVVDRTVPVTGPSVLRVNHRNGNVRLRTHTRSEVQVHAAIRVSAPSDAEARTFADDVQIDVTTEAGMVSIQTRYPDAGRSLRNASFAVDYDIVIPERMDVDVHSSFGDVSVTGSKAVNPSAITNAQGRVSLSDVTGTYRIENQFGAIDTARINGSLTIVGANGAVSVNTVSGAVIVTNRFGDVTASGIKGDASINNSNGRVVASAIGGRTELSTSFGSIDVRDVGSLMLTSSNGNVTGERISGQANVRASFGKVDLRGISQHVTVENQNGNVTLTDVRGNADARTTFGAVLVTNVSGRLQVVSANGDVTVRQVDGGADISGRFGKVDASLVKGGLRVTSANADIRAADVDGMAFVKTSFGLVQTDRVKGPLTVDNSNGTVQATGIAGPATVSTSFARIVLRDVAGRVEARNRNGAIEVAPSATPGACHDIILTSSFGSIVAAIAEAGYTVNARTTFGKIGSEFPITSTVTAPPPGGMLAGTIRGGGCQLQITNSNGDIQIRRRD